MKITYDAEVDALYIRLIEEPRECVPLRLTEEITINRGPNQEIVGIEILDASEVLGFSRDNPEIRLASLRPILDAA